MSMMPDPRPHCVSFYWVHSLWPDVLYTHSYSFCLSFYFSLSSNPRVCFSVYWKTCMALRKNSFVDLSIQITTAVTMQVCSSDRIAQSVPMFCITSSDALPSGSHPSISSSKDISFHIVLGPSPLGYTCSSQQPAGQLCEVPKKPWGGPFCRPSLASVCSSLLISGSHPVSCTRKLHLCLERREWET